MPPTILFDRRQLRRQRDRAARADAPDFLLREAAARLADRLDDITRPFPLALDLGAHHGLLAETLAQHPRIGTLISAEPSSRQLALCPSPKLQADEEFLPFAPGSLDAVFSLLSLHWVNDLPGTLAQIERALKPDGLFLAILPGAATLHELRDSLTHAETSLSGGLRPRVIPFVDVRDAGSLLQRAGFALPVVDSDILTVSYPDPFALMHELRAMGEANALAGRPRHFAPRRLLLEAAAHYAATYADAEGRITASVEFLTLTAWKRADSQPQPAKRGSGKLSLAAALTGH